LPVRAERDVGLAPICHRACQRGSRHPEHPIQSMFRRDGGLTAV
jgi:hypothetical protein